jgi:hypothetical protein
MAYVGSAFMCSFLRQKGGKSIYKSVEYCTKFGANKLYNAPKPATVKGKKNFSLSRNCHLRVIFLPANKGYFSICDAISEKL